MKMLSLRFLPVPLFLLALAAGLAPHSQAQSVEVAPVSTIRAVAGQQTIRTLDDPASARILDPSIATVAAADGYGFSRGGGSTPRLWAVFEKSTILRMVSFKKNFKSLFIMPHPPSIGYA